MLEKSINLDEKMSNKTSMGSLEDNLNVETDSYSKMKNKNHTLSNLLESIKKDTYDSGNDSDGSSEESEAKEVNFNSLIEAMTSCDLNKKSDKTVKDNLDVEQKVPKVKQSMKIVNTDNDSTNSKNHSNQVKNDFDSVLISKDSKQTKPPATIKLHVHVKKSSKSQSKKNKEKPKTECDQSSSSSANELNKIVNQLTKKLSTIDISKERKTAEISKSDLEHGLKINKQKKKEVIFQERGPISTSVNHLKKDRHPYGKKEVHYKAFSGGKVLMKEPPQIIEDVLPITISNNLEIRIEQHINNNQIVYESSIINEKNAKDIAIIINELNQNVNDCVKTDFQTEETLNLLTEILHEDQTKKISEDNYKNPKDVEFQGIMRYLCDETSLPSLSVTESIYDEGKNENLTQSPEFEDNTFFQYNLERPNMNMSSSSPLEIQSKPTQDPNYLTPDSGIYGSYSNRSPYEYSPKQGLRSPSMESTDNVSDNAHFYDSLNSSIPSISKESYGSVSSSNSPSFQGGQEDIFNFLDNSILLSNTDMSFNTFNVNKNPQSPEAQLSNSSPYSNAYSEYSYITQSPNNLYGDSNAYTSDEKSPSNVDAFVPSLEKSPQYYANHSNDFKINNQQIRTDSSVVNASKSTKRKVIPIASKEGWPCCVDSKKSASDILIEMFNRLDKNMQRRICNEVHKVDEDKLMELFDGQLSSWNNIGLQFQRLPLLHATCERLLMQSKTMAKFFEVYGNGHTVLDRAVLTCSQTPLVAKYLAECMIKSISHLSHVDNSALDKSDRSGSTVLHRAASRGEHCSIALASLLSINDQCPKPVFNVNRLNVEGSTPLHIACSRHLTVKGEFRCPCQLTAHVLLKHGKADPNQRDHLSGNTALHMAVNSHPCSPTLVKLLLQHGAQQSIKNYKGDTPLDLAKALSRSSSRELSLKQVVDILKKWK